MSQKLTPEKIYSLTPMQEGMLFHSLLNEGSNAYFEQTIIKLKGRLSIPVFEKSFNLLVQRYDILRTIFLYEKIQKPRQVVLKERLAEVYFEDISTRADKKEYTEAYIAEDKKKGFDLSRDMLIRVSVLQTGTVEYTVVWSFHHILMDGWCTAILLNDFFTIYKAQNEHKEYKLPPIQPYQNYIKWLEKQDKEKAQNYWKNYVSGYESTTDLPLGVKPTGYNYAVKNREIVFGKETTALLTGIAEKNNVSLNTVMQVIWGILLQKYNNTNDIIFGSVVSGRNPEVHGVEEMVGLFINTIPIRITDNNNTVEELLLAVQKNSIESAKYDYFPLAEIQKHTAQKHELINNIMVFENFPVGEKAKDSLDKNIGFEIADFSLFEQTNYELNLIILPGSSLKIIVSYNSSRYADDIIEKLENHLHGITEEVVKNTSIKISDISLLSEAEKQHLLNDFNATEVNYPHKTILDLFAKQVAGKAEHTAVVYEDNSLTYAQLDQLTDELAYRLQSEYKIQEGDVIGVLLERSHWVTVSLLGIVKAGGVYLPIDPNYPAERINYILDDSKVNVLITEKTPEKYKGKLISPVHKVENTNAKPKAFDLAGKLKPAYIIYTSGSTGKPKGVHCTHNCLYNLVEWQLHESGIGAGLRTVQYASLSFDVSVQEMVYSISTGGTLYVINNELRLDMPALCEYLKKYEIQLLTMPFSALNLLFSTQQDLYKIKSLKHIITSGEQLQISPAIKEFLQKRPDAKLHNQYGPSETHVVTSYTLDANSNLNNTLPPIGKPISNTTCYIVDKAGNPVPEGVAGELYLGGIQVALGYIHKPELTTEKFVPDTWNKKYTTMYRTGDLAQWLPDGNIKYLGRMDGQVKVRGYRIELGEIETVLLAHEAINEAVVTIVEINGNKEIAAYYISKDKKEVTGLREYLSEKLPEYMVPAYYTLLSKIPLSPNGKVDKKALPEPVSGANSAAEYVAPATETEQKLVTIAEELLAAKMVSITSDFFAIGGHSLSSVVLSSRIEKVFEVKVSISDIFKLRVLRAIAAQIDKSVKRVANGIKKASEQEYYPLSAQQQRLYFLHQLEGIQTSYHISNVLELEGNADKKRLEKALQELVSRHEMLRTAFVLHDEKPVQRVHEHVVFQLEDLGKINSKSELQNKINQFIRPFDLEKPTQMRVGIVSETEQQHYLLIDKHHIISDGVSIGNMVKEFVQLYRGEKIQQQELHYKDYAYWQQQHEQIKANEEHEKYWLSTFSDEVPLLEIPSYNIRPAVQQFEGDSINFELSTELSGAINSLAKSQDSTAYMVLLAMYQVVLSKYSGQEDIVVGTPVAGRTRAEQQDMIGMFVNTLAMRNKPNAHKTFTDYLQEVRTNTLLAFEHQEYPFEQIVEKLQLPRLLNRNPLFDTMFMLQNMDTGVLKMEGLTIKGYSFESKVAKFDLTLQAIEHQGKYLMNLEYSTALYKKERMERLAVHFTELVKVITSNPKSTIGQLSLLTPKEYEKVTIHFNDTHRDYADITVLDMISAQAQQQPDAIALTYLNKKTTYRELEENSNRIAHYLIKKGVQKGDKIALMMDRSDKVIESMLGVLKAGAAYLPLDKSLPENRINYILEDADVKLQLVNGESIGIKANTLSVEDKWAEIQKESTQRPEVKVSGEDLAYIIYTSGSTGMPKGCELEHRNLSNYLHYAKETYLKDDTGNFALYTSLSFDLTVTSIYGSLISGKSLRIYTQDAEMNDILTDMFGSASGTDAVKITPAHISLLKHLNIGKSGIKTAIVGGEQLSKDQVTILWKINPQMKIYNEYGPTETTVGCIVKEVNPDDKKILIGKPIANTAIYILDSALQLVPVGIPGEIWIGGKGVGRGYLNRIELTEERFRPDTFSGIGTMYRTGDIAVWTENGEIEYLGRKDEQVKIRGYRIETGEIENRMLQQQGVSDVIVLDRKDANGEKYLCGYYSGNISAQQLQEALLKELPEYMVPPYFVQMEEIPLTSNGKVDKRALPLPATSTSTKVYIAPETETEKKLAAVWQNLLGIEKAGLQDNFFDLGGNSLKATVLAARIHKEFDKKVSLKEMFSDFTLQGIAKLIDRGTEEKYNRIEAVPEKEYYALSAAQKRMYLLNQLEKDSIAYNTPVALKIKGKIDTEALEKAVQELVNRHEILRTYYVQKNGEPVQVLMPELTVPVTYLKTSKTTPEQQISNEIKPFDLEKCPLIRVKILQQDAENNILLIDMHHIVSDAVSMGILVKDLIALYEGKTLAPLRIQYKDYSEWQTIFLTTERAKAQEKYWKEQFEGELPVLNIPTDYTRPAIQRFEGKQYEFTLDKKLYSQLKKYSQEQETTLFMTLYAVYTVFLAKSSRQNDIIVGTPIAGRTHADLNEVMGMFVNTLALRNYPKSDKKVNEFLKEVKESLLSAYEHQDFPFDKLVEELNLQRDLSRNALFDTMFVLQNAATGEKQASIKGLEFKTFETETNISKFDLTLHAYEGNDTIYLGFEYSTNLFVADTIQRMSKHFLKLLEMFVINDSQTIGELSLLSESEEKELLKEFNPSESTFSSDKTLVDLFEESVKTYPNRIALEYENVQLTYRELDVQSGQLAAYISEKITIKKDDIIAIQLERNEWMIVAIMAVLKSGAAYLPIDTEYPSERIKYLLEDSKAKLLLNKSELQKYFEWNKDKKAVPAKAKLNSTDLAYIIYTSGSTGNPKGVMVQHRSVVNLVQSQLKEFGITEEEKILQFSNITFDASVEQLFMALSSGACLNVINKETILDPVLFGKYITERGITHVHTVPGVLKTLPVKKYPKLKRVIAGGDNCSMELAQSWSNYHTFYNEYGPTETTVTSIELKYEKHYAQLPALPIGKPIGNTYVYIADENLKLQPAGVPGEILIGGEGVTRGYLNRPELTEEKFVNNPFRKGEKLYKTGDLGRWLRDGNIVCMGRIDHQVKIRGYRIELGEIENCLQKITGVTEAVVLLKTATDGDKYLCAYVVLNSDISTEKIKAELAKELPEYMHPSYFVKLEKMPLLTSGKVNRKALPEPDESALGKTEYIAPQTEIQQKMAEAWQQVLGVKRIGITDNFFHMGGHSLKAVQAISLINSATGLSLSMKDLFVAPTIQKLSAVAHTRTSDAGNEIKVLPEAEVYPVSKAQQGIWLSEQVEGKSSKYNMPVALLMEGELDISAFEKTFAIMLERHEILRTVFTEKEGVAMQRILPSGTTFSIEKIDLSANNNAMQEAAVIAENEAATGFDITQFPLMRARVIKVAESKHVFLFTMHHIISDGWSMQIMLREIFTLYNGFKTNSPVVLEPLKVQYKDYSAWHNSLLSGEKLQKTETYWKDKLTGTSRLKLPLDNERKEFQTFNGAVFQYTFSEELTAKIETIAQEQGMTLYMVLLAYTNILLHKYTNQNDITVGTPIAGRNHKDVESLIGFFINTLVMRSVFQPEITVKEALKIVKDTVTEAYEFQDYPFDSLVNLIEKKRELNRGALVDVVVSLQNLESINAGIKYEPYGLKLSNFGTEHRVSKYDLSFTYSKTGNALFLEIEYNIDLFTEQTVALMAARLDYLIYTISDIENTKLHAIELNSKAEHDSSAIVDQLDDGFGF